MSLIETRFKRPDINKLRIGDVVRMPMSHQNGMSPYEGTVVYIHPKKRFFTWEFTCDSNRIKESCCAYGPANEIGGRKNETISKENTNSSR